MSTYSKFGVKILIKNIKFFFEKINNKHTFKNLECIGAKIEHLKVEELKLINKYGD